MDWILILGISYIGTHLQECICIGMYLEYYSIKRFFFFVIWGKFCHFFTFDAFCVVLAHKKAFSIF
ncbi:hypothetical protein BGL79_05835 [Helicobacter pylori]|nr:hypothetical protein BGL79_05835 [Helicobacter pylori]